MSVALLTVLMYCLDESLRLAIMMMCIAAEGPVPEQQCHQAREGAAGGFHAAAAGWRSKSHALLFMTVMEHFKQQAV
jgi:hypothetical protein